MYGFLYGVKVQQQQHEHENQTTLKKENVLASTAEVLLLCFSGHIPLTTQTVSVIQGCTAATTERHILESHQTQL